MLCVRRLLRAAWQSDGLLRPSSCISRSYASSPAVTGPAPTGPVQARYEQLLATGSLQPDAKQQEVVQQLDQLLQQLSGYRSQVDSYRSQLADYEARSKQRLSQLVDQELHNIRREQEQRSKQTPAPTGATHANSNSSSSISSGTSWFGSLLSSFTPQAAGSQAPQQLDHAQQHKLAVARSRQQLLKELGPPPSPPGAPKGLYIHGSVGSGKSMLMDMFFAAAIHDCNLDFGRRMHFNAAMLEMHSRLHWLDQQQQKRRAAKEQQLAAVSGGSSSSPDAPSTTTTGGSSADSSDHGGASHWLDHHEEDIQEAGSSQHSHRSSSSSGSVEEQGGRAGDGQIAKWFDLGVLRQKEAKAAVLAIRKHLRASRAGHVPDSRLAAANASVMRAAARSFIRGSSDDVTSGWGAHRGHVAALLCFDEMQVPDVWTAAALKALCEALVAEGCVVVTTSNRPPWELPRHGLHELMFQHFLDTLTGCCQVVELAGERDYRRLMAKGPAAQLLQQPLTPLPPSPDHQQVATTSGVTSSSGAGAGTSELPLQQVPPPPPPAAAAAAATGAQPSVGPVDTSATPRLYFWPLGPVADAALQQAWTHWTGSAPPAAASPGASSRPGAATSGSTALESKAQQQQQQQQLAVLFGRQLPVPAASCGAAWFSFEELCNRPLGAADYLALSTSFHTVFLSGVPAMSMNVRDQARRFITLVDELYNARTLLVVSAACPPDALFTAADSSEEPIIDLESLQFEGAVEGSRLRRDLLSYGGVAPVASTAGAVKEAAALLGGMEEKFAFARAVSRLYEMQSPLYRAARPRRQ